MARIASSPRFARATRTALGAGLALALAACGESGRYGTGPGGGTGGGGGGGGTGGGGVAGAPGVTILQPATTNFPVGVGDSVLIEARVTDDRGVVSVVFSGQAQRGDVNLGTNQTVDRFESKTVTLNQRPDTTIRRYLRAIPGDSTSETVQLSVTATDSAGNTTRVFTTARITQGPRVTVVRPSVGAVSSVGKSITIEVQAIDPQGVRIVGWRTSGVLTRQDSLIVPSSSGALPDTVTFIDTLTVPASTAVGNLIITGFGVDSIGDPSGTTTGVTVAIQSATSDATPPLVTFSVTRRVEGDDSLTLRATDASGIARLGFIVRLAGATTVLAADSQTFSGNQTDVTAQMRLRLDTITTFPRLVTVEAFAVDSVGNRGLSSGTSTPVPGSGTAKRDTVTVVAGRTIALPAGGEIADAVYNRTRNELYLSNLTLNRLEVFQLATSTFVAGGIPVGSRPYGLALWPRDTLGGYGDTVIVANSGGTNLSVVDVAARTERRRHALPNYLIRKIKTAIDPANNTIVLNITEFDYSDRPLYVATVCRTVVGINCTAVAAVYSTTPTPGQSSANRGYMAWEDLTAPSAAPIGHFFWEAATGSASLATDTLEVISVRDPAPGVLSRDTLLGGAVGLIADFNQLVFQDTTYVRNSGDFNHVVIGEGGGTNVAFARALTFDSRAGRVTISGSTCAGLLGTVLKCTGLEDRGISPGIFVRDFIGNRASRVRSVATNFNGRTNLVRADSVYVFDYVLRQTGLLQIGGQNPGMDVHPLHSFDAQTRGSDAIPGNGDADSRVVFAARPDANIEVMDTYFYGSVSLIPVRDTIIGPLRMAQTATGPILVGVTKAGLVVVPLPTAITNPFPARNEIRAAARRRP